MLSRRGFLKLSIAGGAATYVASKASFPHLAQAAQSPQVPLDGTTIPQFVDALPDLDLLVDTGTPTNLTMTEFQAQVLPTGMPPTWVWGYLQDGQTSRASYLGPVIVATRHQPTEMKFINNLGNADTTNVLAYKYGTDQTLHWADPLHDGENMWNHMAMPPEPGSEGAENYLGSIPACPHLHGGYVPPVLDGGPDSWFTSDGSKIGSGFYSKDGIAAKNYCIYRYPNDQEGALVWFHDHTLGATRLNVYSGLAGGYLLVDPANDPTNLPPLIPLVIQDRMFDTDGQLFFPADSAGGVLWALNPEHPYWVPEFIGDVICVNGKVWPYKTVEPKRYTCLFVNGSNARGYQMFLVDPVSGNFGPPLWVIGTDGGYLDKPVKVTPGAGKNNKLIMLPGERYWVIMDFFGYRAGLRGPNGQRYSGLWQLRNVANAPYPDGDPVIPGATDRIMQFNVVGDPGIDTTFNPARPGAIVRPTPLVRLVNPVTGTLANGVTVQKTRQLTLNEVELEPKSAIDPVTGLPTAYPGGPVEVLVNNTKWNGERINGVDEVSGMYTFETRPDFTLDAQGRNYLSEMPNEGETEVWEIVNLTADAHPIHTHLVQFQLMNRQTFDLIKYLNDYAFAFPGGGYDPMTGQAYPAGTIIPSFGPPLDYTTGIPRALGGNPDIATAVHNKPKYLKGKPTPPLPQEAGWKDTVVAYPGQVTRFVVRWAPSDLPANTPPTVAQFSFDPQALGGGYVWHCHIVDHEDNEMMRPDQVTPNPNATRTYIQGVDY
jgi:spore coat protein A, manganese oxidase